VPSPAPGGHVLVGHVKPAVVRRDRHADRAEADRDPAPVMIWLIMLPAAGLASSCRSLRLSVRRSSSSAEAHYAWLLELKRISVFQSTGRRRLNLLEGREDLQLRYRGDCSIKPLPDRACTHLSSGLECRQRSSERQVDSQSRCYRDVHCALNRGVSCSRR
jgi:hypothetical protein